MAGQIPGSGRGPIFQKFPLPPFSRPANSRWGTIGRPAHGINVAPSSAGVTVAAPLGPPPPAYSIAWSGPSDGAVPVLTFSVVLTPTSLSGAAMTVVIQSATTPDFATGLLETTLTGQASGVASSTSLGPFADGDVLYLRARAGDGTSVWSDWSPTVRVTVSVISGDAVEYVTENVGVHTTAGRNAYEYVTENVGVYTYPDPDAIEYVYLYDVDGTPSPYIYALRPTAGRAGDGVTILGAGFGASQAEYSGVVEAYDFDAEAWVTVPVVSWSRIAAGVDAYTAGRVIEPHTPDVDPEHDEVQVTVPGWALPPTMPLRVRTNGP